MNEYSLAAFLSDVLSDLSQRDESWDNGAGICDWALDNGIHRGDVTGAEPPTADARVTVYGSDGATYEMSVRRLCPACRSEWGKSETCPECQIHAAEVVDACSHEGCPVLVTLPDDVEGWYHAEGTTWGAVVVYVNGDSLDVKDCDGNVEPVPAEYCRLAP